MSDLCKLNPYGAGDGDGRGDGSGDGDGDGDGYPLAAQNGLLLLGNPADVPREGSVIIECLHGGLARFGLTYDNNLTLPLAHDFRPMTSLLSDFRITEKGSASN